MAQAPRWPAHLHRAFNHCLDRLAAPQPSSGNPLAPAATASDGVPPSGPAISEENVARNGRPRDAAWRARLASGAKTLHEAAAQPLLALLDHLRPFDHVFGGDAAHTRGLLPAQGLFRGSRVTLVQTGALAEHPIAQRFVALGVRAQLAARAARSLGGRLDQAFVESAPPPPEPALCVFDNAPLAAGEAASLARPSAAGRHLALAGIRLVAALDHPNELRSTGETETPRSLLPGFATRVLMRTANASGLDSLFAEAIAQDESEPSDLRRKPQPEDLLRFAIGEALVLGEGWRHVRLCLSPQS